MPARRARLMMRMPDTDTDTDADTYQETVRSTLIAVLLAVPAAFVWLLLLAQLLAAPLRGEPAPTWLLLALAALLSSSALWFRAMHLRLDADGIDVAYGPFRARRGWGEVSHLEHDAAGGFYGGYGVRFGWREGRSVWVFSTVDTPQVAVVPARKRARGLVVSTRRPHDVLAIAERHLRAAREP